MSRCPGAHGIIDIRSAALVQDQDYRMDPCAPGAEEAAVRRRRCKYNSLLDDCPHPPGWRFDHYQDVITLIGVVCIVMTVMGIMLSYSVFMEAAILNYGMQQVELFLVGAMTYAIFTKVTTLANLALAWVGNKLVMVFGLILLFFGLVIDALVFSTLSFYISHLFFMSVGSSFAYTGAMSLPSDHFRLYLRFAMAILCIATPIGVIIFYPLSIMLVININYRWCKICYAVVVLMLIGAVHAMRKSQLYPQSVNFQMKGNIDAEISECVQNSAYKYQTLNDPQENSCLCVFVCDMSLWSDWSFLLWGFCCLIASMGFYTPYLFLYVYALDVGADEVSPMYYILAYAASSTFSRFGIGYFPDHTFLFNRNIFQLTLIASGILHVLFPWTQTFGWILVWSVTQGTLEGVFVSTIPRVTLQTVPRRWIVSAWSCVLWFQALGIFIGPLLIAVSKVGLGIYDPCHFVIGLIQIICGILAVLLPNEETEDDFYFSDNSGPWSPFRPRCDPGSKNWMLYPSLPKTVITSPPRVHRAPMMKRNLCNSNYNFHNDCPICGEYGCIPECCPEICTPGSLAK